MTKQKNSIHPRALTEGNVALGNDCIVEVNAVLNGPIKSGTNCFFGAGCYIQGPAKIGSNVFFSEMTSVGFPTQPQIKEFQEGIQASPRMESESTVLGDNCIIRNSIIDKNARIGNGVNLVNERNVTEEEAENYVIRDGIIVVPKNAVIPDGTVI